MTLKIRAFIIHLRRAVARQQQIRVLRRDLPVPAQIILAVDGEKLTGDDIRAVYRRRLYKPFYPFRLTQGEIACFLSHRKAWQTIIDQKLQAGFVVEDDVALTADFDNAFSLACRYLTPESFFRFCFRNSETGPCVATEGPVRLIRPTPVGLGQVAHLAGYEAARKLLAATRRFDRPVDTMSQLFWITGVRPLSLIPGGVQEISATLGGSTLKRHCPLPQKLYHEIMRPLYRTRVTVLSRIRK